MASTAKVIGIAAIAAAIGAVGWTVAHAPKSLFNAKAVTCFPTPDIPGAVPEVVPLIKQTRSDEDEIDERRRGMASVIDGAIAGAALCNIAACDPQNRSAYFSKTSFYLNSRQNMARRLFREKGEYGLRIAYDVSNTAQDAAIVDNLQALYAAKTISLRDFGTLRAAAALLATKPATAFVPCDTLSPKPSKQP